MDPISAAIMAGGSLAGSAMNVGGTLYTNAQNAAAQAYAAGGGYLPQLVKNAGLAGLSPLAVLGYHAPPAGGNVFPDAGSGVAGAAKAIAEIKDPHTVAMEKIAEDQGRSQVLRTQAETSNAKLDAARTRMILDALGQGEQILNRLNRGSEELGNWFSKGTLWNLPGAIHDTVNNLFGSSPQTRITIPRSMSGDIPLPY